MGRIYESEEDYQRAFEEEFRQKCDEFAYYQGDQERVTIDHEWTESDLKEALWEAANKILNGDKNTKGWLELNSARAVKDEDLLKPEFLVNDICDRYDMIEVYNRAYDMHRNDKPMEFGIRYFDALAEAEVKKTLKNNLITK